MTKGKTVFPFLLAFCAVLAAIAPLLPTYYVGLLSQALIFAIFAMSLDLLVGFAGLPSLGHSAFFGMGAYTAGLLVLRGDANFWLCAGAGVTAALLVAAVFGFLTVRTGGSYFLMITLALSQILWGIAFKWRALTGGEDGLSGITRPAVWMPWNVQDHHGFFYLVLVFFALAGLLLVLFVQSPFGLALQGVRESETRMEALGYPVWSYRYFGYVYSGGIAGFAGVLFAYYNGFVSPNDLSIGLSAKGLLMVIIGGAGTLVGAILGSGVIVLLEHVVSDFTQRWMTIIGIIYVLVVLFFPKGVLGTVGEKLRKARS
jgi:branched-chain amino acid transport system permease protein